MKYKLYILTERLILITKLYFFLTSKLNFKNKIEDLKILTIWIPYNIYFELSKCDDDLATILLFLYMSVFCIVFWLVLLYLVCVVFFILELALFIVITIRWR